MRILAVRFRNLNSLFGEWHIDFTRPEYLSDGIFAITGPTGAGKTTVLDAVCLGLYGRTPRLDKVTKGSNEIMSRQAGDCYAEVTFETQKGRYRCHWSQHRARKRPAGELQPARHEVADAASGAVLETGISQVASFIVHVTGMDFERFTRSMLLAQGGFAAFLEAPPDARAPILEQITGTEIYSRISMRVHARRSAERDELERLQAELQGIRVLSTDEEGELRTSLGEKQLHETQRSEQIEGLRRALAWCENIEALERGIAELEGLAKDLGKRAAEFAPQGKRLARSRRALSLEGDYREVAGLRELQLKETQELEDLHSTQPVRDKAREAALNRRQAAEKGLDQARKILRHEAELIRKVRDLDTRLDEQKRQLQERETTRAKTEQQLARYQAAIEQTSQTLQKAEDDLRAVQVSQAQHARDAALMTTLTAIERGFASLSDMEARLVTADKAGAAAAAEAENAAARCRALEDEHAKAREAFEQVQEACAGLADKAARILKGRDLTHWRREAEGQWEREHQLQQTLEIIARLEHTSSEIEEQEQRLAASLTGHQTLLAEISTCGEKKALLEGTTAAMEKQAALLHRIRDLEEERQRLIDGQPCPLCGALDHPYARGNIPEPDQAESGLKDARAALGRLTDNLGMLEARRAGMAAEIRHAEQALDDKRAAREADEVQLTAGLRKLKLAGEPENRARKIGEALAHTQGVIKEISSLIADSEALTRQEKAVHEGREKAREILEGSAGSLQEARHRLDTAGREQARLTREAQALAREADRARLAALRDVEPFGIRELGADIGTILKDLTARRDAWKAGLEVQASLEVRIHDLQTGLTRDRALLEKLEGDLKEQLGDLDKLKVQHTLLNTERFRLYADKNTDQEELRLTQSVDQALRTYETEREAHAKLEQELSVLKERAASLEGRTLKRSAGLDQADQRLKAKLLKAGFEDEGDYLCARIPEEEHENLTRQEQALISEKTQLEARRRDKQATLEANLQKQLTDLPPETLREELLAAEADLKQTRTDIGGLLAVLKENAGHQERLQERITAVAAQKDSCAQWDDLHQLIGSADGKKFRNFAQGLTFEMLIAHANRQLCRMSDRYLLIHDATRPLELNVIDNYQAGEIRSTKNLSGGEGFIVSLALALGLSQMASRKVRVDSLFLDEGFGTLDEDALEDALETLAGLRQDGKLIGVISHVSALKERIGTQIQVIPQTGGRSTLAGPGCLRIREPSPSGSR